MAKRSPIFGRVASSPLDESADAAPASSNDATAASPSTGAHPAETGAPLQGPQVPPSCGPAHRLRPDIAAALMWGPRDRWALTADRLIRFIGDTELVLVITCAWLSPQGWGLLSVTTDRVLYVPTTASEDSFAQPIPSMLWLLDDGKTNEHGDRRCNLVDLERNIVMWFETSASIEAVNTAIRWAARVHTNIQPGYESADTNNVLEEFSRFAALHRAHETGALDTDSLRLAVSRLFGLGNPAASPPFPPSEPPTFER